MVVTTTVVMQQGYSLYEDKRGINTIELPYKTDNYERGGAYYPNSLEVVKGSGVELSYADYCSNLSAAGCNLLRLKWFGGNSSSDGGWCALEPPPYGTYNIWQTALDPSNLTTYRSQQVTYPVGAAAWAASNMKEFIEQCEANSIFLHVILFETSEFGGYPWTFHAWNASNRYIDNSVCELADRGFLATDRPYDFYTDATAIQAAKDRIDFVVDMLGDNKAVVSWELFAEMSWLVQPGFWDVGTWGEMIPIVRNNINPWVTTMGNYLRAADPYNRPIGMGLVIPRQSGGVYVDWPADPDHAANLRNEPMIQYPIDICCMNLYDDTFENCVDKFRLAKEKVGGKILWATQHSPIQMDPLPREEPSPYSESIKRTWINVCGERWGLTSVRWPGLYNPGTGWATGGYADPNFYSIPGVVSTFNAACDWNATWDIDNYVFDDYVVATGTSSFLSYGDGEHVTMHMEFSSGGNKNITFSNISNGAYTFTYYNWVDGTIEGTGTPTAVGGSCTVTVDVTSLSDNFLVAHLLKD